MAERRADPRRRPLHRGDAGDPPHVEAAPRRRAGFERLEDGSRHGEDAWIPARNDRDLTSGRGERERLMGARQLLAVVARMPGLIRSFGDAWKIRRIAE